MLCCLSWLTNSALVYEPECGGLGSVGGGGEGAGSRPMSTAVHMELRVKKYRGPPELVQHFRL